MGVFTGKKILLVEDETALRAALARLLKREVGDEGSVTESVSADEGVRSFDASPDAYDIILTDLDTKSTLSGMDLIEHVRNKGSKVPILLFTSQPMDTHTFLEKFAPCSYVQKPISRLQPIIQAFEKMLPETTRTLG